MNLLQLSWKNLTNKPLSMLLSLVLFALGAGMISLVFLLERQVQDKFKKNLADIGVVIGAKGSPLQMILCNMYHVDDPTGNILIKDARPFLNPKHPLIEKAVPLSLGDSYSGFRIVGTTHDYPALYEVKVSTGKLWGKDFEVTIGAEVAKIAKLKIGDTFTSSHGFVTDGLNDHEHGEFRVVGIFEPSNSVIDQVILCTTQSIWEVHEHEEKELTGEVDKEEHSHADHDDHDHSHDDEVPSIPLMDQVDKEITSILIRLKNKTSFPALNMVRGINENTEVMAASPAIELNQLYDQMNEGEKFLRALGLIIVFVSGFSVFISLFSSLQDRKYELALMRVMGASRGTLFIMIILEGLLLAVLGYILGIILSHLAMIVVAAQMQEAYHYSFSSNMFLKEELYLLAGALLIGFLAAVVPAIQALRTDISKTLSSGN